MAAAAGRISKERKKLSILKPSRATLPKDLYGPGATASPQSRKLTPTRAWWRTSRSTKRPARSKSRKLYYVIDATKIINPLIFHGHIHGGVIQGLGFSLTEHLANRRRPGHCAELG